VKKRNKKLMKLYSQLLAKAKDYELILLYNGANLHPEFLKELKTFNVQLPDLNVPIKSITR
jgi:hypothetical protein